MDQYIDPETTVDEPALGISVTINVDGQTQVNFRTHMPLKADDSAVNALMDRVLGYSERLQKKQSLAILKKKEDELTKAIVRGQEDLVSVDEKQSLELEAASENRRQPPRNLVARQQSDRNMAVKSIERWKEDLKETRDLMALIEKL